MHFMGTGVALHEEVHLTFRYKFFSRIFCCLGLVFIFSALISPYWLIIRSPKDHINVGLWNICMAHNCRRLDGHTQILLLTRTLMSISTICGLVSVACVFLTESNLKDSKWPLISNFCTGAMSLITVLLYGLSLKSRSPLGRPYPTTSFPIYISWAFVMACFATCFFLINGLLFVLIELQASSRKSMGLTEPK